MLGKEGVSAMGLCSLSRPLAAAPAWPSAAGGWGPRAGVYGQPIKILISSFWHLHFAAFRPTSGAIRRAVGRDGVVSSDRDRVPRLLCVQRCLHS